MSYRELDERSASLAVQLIHAGAKPETFFGLCFEKSACTPMAMLAVLRAGAAFVFLDPQHPPEYLQTVCVKAGIQLAITSVSKGTLLTDLVETVLVADMAVPKPASSNDLLELSRVAVTPSNAAFAVFTSGSTGEPKGIVMAHQAASTYGIVHANPLNLTRQSRIFQFASYTFDVSIGDHIHGLMTGACRRIPSEDDRRSNICGAIKRFQANWAVMTPSIARILPPSVAAEFLKTLILL